MSEREGNLGGNLGQPEYRMTIDGEEYFANRLNTKLYTFIGKGAIKNHVFLSTGEDANHNSTGAFVFETAQEGLYKRLCKFIVDNNLPQDLNANRPADCDTRAWERIMFGDLDKGVPEEWFKDES